MYNIIKIYLCSRLYPNISNKIIEILDKRAKRRVRKIIGEFKMKRNLNKGELIITVLVYLIMGLFWWIASDNLFVGVLYSFLFSSAFVDKILEKLEKKGKRIDEEIS